MKQTPNSKQPPNLREEPRKHSCELKIENKENDRQCTFTPSILNTKLAREIQSELKPWEVRQ
jgi:hypothetical protein